jgi:hypothetical protein
MYKHLLSCVICVFLAGCAKPTDPESMALPTGGYSVVARLQMPSTAQDIVVRDSVVYLAAGEGGLATVNVAVPSRPRILSPAQLDVKGTCIKITLNQNAVYLAANTFGVTAIDISNPAQPLMTVTNIGIKPAHAFHVFGQYLMTATGESGVKFADVSDPMHPDVQGDLSSPGYARGMVTTEDSLCLVVASGELGLTVFDIREMRPPSGGFGTYRKIGWTDTPGYANDVALLPNSRIAFVACGTAGVQVISFADTVRSDSLSVHTIGTYSTGGYAKEVHYNNGRLYVTTELRGLQVLSVENPAAPRLVGSVKTEFALGVAVANGYVYIADETEGLIIASIPPY